MKNKKILSISLLAIIFVSVLISRQFGFFRDKKINRSLSIKEESVEVDSQTDVEVNPEEVVGQFLENFILASPPNFDKVALEKATSLLSQGLKMNLSQEPIAGELARLLGVQDLPDNGYDVELLEYMQNPATKMDKGVAKVRVGLGYSGGNVFRVFSLSKVEGGWLIDKISDL